MTDSDRQERVFRALASPTRRQILDRLRDHAMTTGQLCDELDPLDRCTVMQHLGVLERADLLIVRQEGRHRWNYLNAVPIQRIYDRWISQFARPSVELLARLRQDLEEPPNPPRVAPEGIAVVRGDAHEVTP